MYEIVQHFENMSKDGCFGPKLTAYSGHDSNLIGILCTLGVFDRIIPPHASSIFFELWKKNGEHYVNVYYKNEKLVPVTIAGGDFNCKLNHFKRLLGPYFISKDDFYKDCSL